MFLNPDQISNLSPPSPRVVVVGAGAVGLYAASQLAARGREVIVVESGTAQLGSFSSETYSSVGRPHSGIKIGRSRTLGGTTNLWGGQLVQFQPIDFDGRDWLPNSRWPVSYDEIAPFYEPTYLNLGVPPSQLEDDQIWREVSTARPDLGSDFEVFLTRWMSTPNFAELFAKQIQADPKFAVLAGFTAVEFGGTGPRIDSVRVVDERGQSRWIGCETVILAAGTIENARLLLHAANNPGWKAPWANNPNVGRFFQDHLGGRIASFEAADKKRFFSMFSNLVVAGRKFQPKIRMRNEAQQRQQIFNTQVFFAFESAVSEHMVYLKQFLRAALYNRKLTGAKDVFRNGFSMARYLVPLMWKYVWEHRVFVPSTARIDIHVQAEHTPLAASAICVDPSSLDAYGLPRVILNWRIGDRELESLRSFAVQVRDALKSAGLGQMQIDEDLLAGNPAFLAKLGDTYHQAGGANMADSAEHGVVDRDLRVFGTENLYVTGASVFPTTSNANTTFTALTFTTRLVDHLTGTSSLK